MNRIQVFRAALAAAWIGCAGGNATAQTFTILHTFTGQSDGADPRGGVTLGKNGMIYGTTSGGGSTAGLGTIFSSDQSGNLVTLHVFNEVDGATPKLGS